MIGKTHEVRNSFLCMLIFTVCFWATWPIAAMGFGDDWSYIKSAQVFAQTGRFVYNGWATAMLGWQIPWGALFIRLFGFSFMAVKLSTFPLALATLFLFHLILVRFGISARNAIIGTLTLGLSPLFMPLAASFMTDISGLFVIVLCLYCCQRAVQAQTHTATIAWLSFAAASNLAGGTVRQIVWLGALVMVPSTGWLLRKRRGVLPTALALWIVCIVGVLYSMHWFAQQRYSIQEDIFRASFSDWSPVLIHLLLITMYLSAQFLCLLLVVFPLLIVWLPHIRKISRSSFTKFVIFLVIWIVFESLFHWELLWPQGSLFKEFATFRDASAGSALDVQTFFLPWSGRLAISMLVLVTFLACVASVRLKLGAQNRTATPNGRSEIFWLCTPFVSSYFALLLPRAATGEIYDRYVLGIMPFAILCLLWLYQRHIAQELPAYSAFALIVYTILAIAGTHDWYAWQRARLAAINEVRAAKVPRRNIQGGFEYDGWTQIEYGGHINDQRIQIPADAYAPNPDISQPPKDCRLDFAPKTPVVKPKFTTVFGPKWCLAPSQFPPVHYRCWLPPFQRTIYILRIPPALPN